MIYLPDNVSVFPILGVRLVVGAAHVLLQVVDGDVTIVQSHHQHVRVLTITIHQLKNNPRGGIRISCERDQII